jgi:peptidyl-prolyl cis-trans isomerase A (cyclophilin A)
MSRVTQITRHNLEESEKMHVSKFAASTAALLFFSAIPSLGQTASAQTTPAKPKSTPAAKTPASPYDRALLKPDSLKDVAPATYQVKFETTRGDFTVTVTRAWAPLAADRFYNLVKHHYFDDARFFRVVPGFVVQFGLSAYPPVTAAWEKATIQDEPVTQKNKRGTLTFAKTSAPNSRTTQIFINLKDNSSSLDSQGFAPFGVVDGNGMNVVEMFYDQYGDSAGMDQANIEKLGEKYLVEKWPRLDQIKSATIVGDTAATAPSKPATTTKATGGKPQP